MQQNYYNPRKTCNKKELHKNFDEVKKFANYYKCKSAQNRE